MEWSCFNFEDVQFDFKTINFFRRVSSCRENGTYSYQVSSIRFEEASPKVYTYLDELSAMVKKEWEEGVQIDYEVFLSIEHISSFSYFEFFRHISGSLRQKRRTTEACWLDCTHGKRKRQRSVSAFSYFITVRQLLLKTVTVSLKHMLFRWNVSTRYCARVAHGSWSFKRPSKSFMSRSRLFD